jgi:membrane fusion protein
METRPEPDSAPQVRFSAEALEHLRRDPLGSGLLVVSPPWSWRAGLALGLLVVTGLALALFGQVEINERGQGVLRPVEGVRHVQARIPGTVAEVLSGTGCRVDAGQALLRLEAPHLSASLVEADDHLRCFGPEFQGLERREAALHEQHQATAAARILQLERDQAGQRRSVARLARKAAAVQHLVEAGILPDQDREEAREALDQGERELRALGQALLQARQESAQRESGYRRERWSRGTERSRALSRRRALEYDLGQGTLAAPLAGFVDTLLVRRGDSVQAGQTVARIVPGDARLQVLGFLDEAHRAWIKAGDRVKLELSQFPYAEFGTLDGRILYVGMDFASPEEIRAALGESARLGAPAFKVELEVLPARDGPLAKVELRPGMRLDVRFTLRRQSPIAFAFEPLKRWWR